MKIMPSNFLQVTKDLGLPFINLATLIKDLTRASKRFQNISIKNIFVDNVHFSEMGNSLQAQLISPINLRTFGCK